ncbi:MAG: radical SAM/SPASM domain-containing protein [Nitrospiraceae bacterium]
MKHLKPDAWLESVTTRAAMRRRPEGVTFELTYGCNLRCLHCYNPTHRILPEELTTAEVGGVLEQLAEFGVLSITFTGGEPSVRPDIATILRQARSHGFVIQLLTNATRITPSFADVLVETGIHQVNVSIYGATEMTYERMTGIPGSYTLFRQGLTCLALRQISVNVRMPVTTLNEHEVPACRALIEPFGFKFQYCLDVMPRTNGDTTPLQYRLSPEAKRRIDQAMLNRSAVAIEDQCSSDRPFIECACGKTRFAITPYGEMNLCVAFPIPRYNLRAGSVKDGWEILKQTVDHARPNANYECPACEVRSHCRQGRSDAWLETGDMSACLPHFKDLARLEQTTYVAIDSRPVR